MKSPRKLLGFRHGGATLVGRGRDAPGCRGLGSLAADLPLAKLEAAEAPVFWHGVLEGFMG